MVEAHHVLVISDILSWFLPWRLHLSHLWGGQQTVAQFSQILWLQTLCWLTGALPGVWCLVTLQRFGSWLHVELGTLPFYFAFLYSFQPVLGDLLLLEFLSEQTEFPSMQIHSQPGECPQNTDFSQRPHLTVLLGSFLLLSLTSIQFPTKSFVILWISFHRSCRREG